MNNPLDPTLRELSACGCCAGTGAQTPSAIDNRPGLPAIACRSGVHSQFKATLLAALSSHDHPALCGLRTREEKDFTIALLDAFSAMADVLTFYSERIANESYLRTATERRSVLELARAIGYELKPGVSAGVMLAFTVEGGRGAPGTAIIPRGTKVQSIPGPGEKPQVFETSVDFEARASWNELRPRLRFAPLPAAELPGVKQLFLAGTDTNLKPGDVLVLSDGMTAKARRVSKLRVDRESGHTWVTFEAEAVPSVTRVPATPASAGAKATHVSISNQPTAKTVGGLFTGGSVSAREMFWLGHFQKWDMAEVQKHLNKLPKVALSTPTSGVFALRTRVSFFGHNAPRWASLQLTTKVVTTVVTNPPPPPTTTSVSYKNEVYPQDWDGISTANPATEIWEDSQGENLLKLTDFHALLERSVPEVVSGSWVVLEPAGSEMLALRVGRAADLSQADYAISAKCTGLQLLDVDGNPLTTADKPFKNRTTTAYVQSEPLTVIGAPIKRDLQQGDTKLPLDRVDMDLKEGQTLALKGENADLSGTTQREMIVIAEVDHGDVTILTLRDGLQHSYIRSRVTLNANVAPATHGETTEEVVGSGDATQAFQRFSLKQTPLTYVLPPGAGLLESSLEVWVDDVRWRETATFYETGPQDHVYVVLHEDNGTTTVQFGDGRHGARLPSGRENVRAVYRKGIGLDGQVKKEQLSLLLTQPLGVKGVSNPLAPQGAEIPQSLGDARINAPRTVLTLDRVVSLQDYEDFSRDFSGVAKAHAAWCWSGQARGILLTLLGPLGAEINETGQPADRLRTALADQGSARVPVRIATRPPSLFSLRGTVRVEADRAAPVMETAVRAALLDAFSFAARDFGQGVHLSEVIAVIQNVPGVAFVDVEDGTFQKTIQAADGDSTETRPAKNDYLMAYLPANGVDMSMAEPAELLILDETSLTELEVRAL